MTKSEVNSGILQRKINGQTKPFIDKDLQIQIPGTDAPRHTSEQRTKSIYLHYCKEREILPELVASEESLNVAMAEAKQAHEAWKKMQAQIQQAAKV